MHSSARNSLICQPWGGHTNRIERAACSDEQRALVGAADGEASGTLGDLQDADLPALPAVHIDLVAGDVHVARCISAGAFLWA